MERLARAKINLALHVLGRRPDGYHELDTLVVFASHGDRLDVSPSASLSLELSGRFADHAPGGEADLTLRAARLLQARAGRASGARIWLNKSLPAGAGFGGGSADAAAALRALNALWQTGLGDVELAALGGALGADVPMCLDGRTLRARGVGDRIEPAQDWPTLALALVWPGAGLSTALVFRALEPRENSPLPPLPAAPSISGVVEWLAACRNDLEPAARAAAPPIAAALAALRASRGCMLARMSGSGSGCFGIYDGDASAAAAAAAIAAAEPAWWARAVRTGEPS